METAGGVLASCMSNCAPRESLKGPICSDGVDSVHDGIRVYLCCGKAASVWAFEASRIVGAYACFTSR